MILELALTLQAAFAAPSSAGTARPLSVSAQPDLAMASLRDEVARLFAGELEPREALRSMRPQTNGMTAVDSFQPLLDSLDEYVDYYLAYYAVHGALVDAVQHAYFINTPSCGATTQLVATGMSGGYVAGQTFLVAAPPNASGQTTVFGSHGGSAAAQPFTLLPMPTPGTAQGGNPAFNRLLHHYSSVQSNGFSHSGAAVQVDLGGGVSQLVLYPDATVGTSVFQPSDLVLLRWLLLENAAILPSFVFDAILPPFQPPGDPSDDKDFCTEPTLAERILCCMKALQKWKKDMTNQALYDQAWAKQNANEAKTRSDALEADIREHLGSHAVDVVMNDAFLMDTGGIPLEQLQPQLDAYSAQKSANDQVTNTAETNRTTAKANAIGNINAALSAALWPCLDGLPEAAAIHAEIMSRPLDLVF